MKDCVAIGGVHVSYSALIGGNYPKPKTGRTGKGRKRTTTTARQKREKIKRKNKG